MPTTYIPNQFREYKVVSGLQLTAIVDGQQVPVVLRAGDTLLYDGFTLTYGGVNYKTTSIRSAIDKKSWIVPAVDYDPNTTTVDSAGVQVRTPSGRNSVGWDSRVQVHQDERPVLNVTQHAASVRYANADRDNFRRSNHEDGIVVREGFAVPANDRTPVRASQATVLITNLQKKAQLVPGETVRAPLDPAEEAALIAQKEQSRARYLTAPQLAAAPPLYSNNQASEEPPQPHTVFQDGVKMTMNFPMPGSVGKAAPTLRPRQEPELEPMKTAPKPALKELPPEVKVQIATTICPEFPSDYNFDLPARKRVARLQYEFDDKPDVIQAAYRVETDEVKSLLVASFPEFLSS